LDCHAQKAVFCFNENSFASYQEHQRGKYGKMYAIAGGRHGFADVDDFRKRAMCWRWMVNRQLT